MTSSADDVIGFHHPGIVVPDLEQGIQFYTQLLGYELYSQSSWSDDNDAFNQIVGLTGSAARFCMLKGKNSYIELFEYARKSQAPAAAELPASSLGLRHICIAVRDVDVVLARCVKLGGAKINDPVSVPGGATAVYCRDPFGNLIELVRPGGRFPALPA